MNPYRILGVPENASPEQIKKAFHALALKHHPDRGGDVEEFKRISEAYALLKKQTLSRPSTYAHSFYSTTYNSQEEMLKAVAAMLRQQGYNFSDIQIINGVLHLS